MQAPVQRCQKTISTILSQNQFLAVAANFANRLIHHVLGQGLACLKHPDSVLLFERRVSSNRAQRDFLSLGINFQRVSRFELQFFAERLRKNDTARLINGKFACHYGIQYTMPFASTEWYLLLQRSNCTATPWGSCEEELRSTQEVRSREQWRHRARRGLTCSR